MRENVQGVVVANVRLYAQILVVKFVKLPVALVAQVHVKDYVLSVVPVVLILRNKMKKSIIILVCVLFCITEEGQEHCVLETRFRNPVDTTIFHRQPTLLLFVHSKCNHGRLCPTMRMQESLEKDSLQIRKRRGIKLYVVYPSYNVEDIKTFDSFNPVLSEVVFYTAQKHKGSFHEGNATPYIVLYDGNGNAFTRLGGTYEDLCELIETKIASLCPVCNGR